ncbi:MAG: hypothetical protein LC663_04030 [Actinobacteria bacterium]|nr:hypothetical protein [Actinomycetota bacterium]
MRDPRIRAIIIGVALLAVVVGVVLTGSGHKKPAAAPTPTQTPSVAPTCIETPARAPMPAWYPEDLPLPAGTFATTLTRGAPVPGYRQLVLIVPTPLQRFIQFALSEWRKDGWTLGVGDSEPGEAEDTFAKKGTARYGAFRANSYLCDKSSTMLYIIVGHSPAPSPTPTSTNTRPLRSP